MLKKLLFESSKNKSQDKSSHHYNIFESPKINIFAISQKILYHKYSKFEYSFSLLCTNNLIFNEKCRIVARFKDFLVLDDSTEFLRRFYSKKELKTRLQKIFNFYESYCKIFPNYMILPESQFLYRNIRKKQKMIDAFNEIKKEEEENRKHLKLGLVDENLKNKEQNVVFTKKIQESIDRYHPSVSNLLSSTFMSDINNNNNNLNNENNSEKNIFSISLNSQRPLNFLDFDKYFLPEKNSFLENDKNINDNTINSQNSIFKIVQILNNNNINDFNNNSNNKDVKNNNMYNTINKIEYKNHISQFNSKKIIKKNNNINNNNNHNISIKHNTKKLLNNNNNNNYNTINSNSNKNININKINNINNSNHKKQKQDNNNNNINTKNKNKFISHKQTVSVPLAANMLNNNDNIVEEKNTIKIINNINNIIINDDKNKTINNGMIININNNYFQLKDPKNINNKLIKRVKSKEEQKKEKTKETKIFKDKEEKEEHFHQNFKIFREKRTYTSYNTQNNTKNNKQFIISDIQSPNKKKENNNNSNNIDNKKDNKNTNTNNNYKQNNVYRNNNNQNENKKNNKRLIESRTVNNNSNNTNNNKNNTEINNNYKNIFGNKLKIPMHKNKEKPKIDGIDSIDIKKMSINRKIVNNYLTTQKKKSYQGRFQGQENVCLNTNNNANKKYNDISDKIEVLNIYNTIQNKNNPIKFKLDKKNMIRKIKTNSVQINNNNEFLSSFNLTKEKIPGTNIEIDIINIEDNFVKYHKKSIKKLLNNKTQSNSEAELIKDMNNKNNGLNSFTSKSLKKNIYQNNNDKKINNNEGNNINKINSNEIKKINVKEMKEKYHKLLRGNKFTHGSYDTTNRMHLFKKLRGLNNVMGTVTNNINSTITSSNKNKRSPLAKKNISSPSDRVQNAVGNYIKTPNKNKYNLTNKETSIENNNNNNNNVINGNKFHLINKKNKQIDTNNKKMKFIKK